MEIIIGMFYTKLKVMDMEYFNLPEDLNNDHYIHLSLNKNDYFNESAILLLL